MGLSHSLNDNVMRTEIYLAYNYISNKGATAIGTALKANTSLATLDLDNFGMSDNRCAALFDILCKAALTVLLS